jgi:bacterial/archaeal transporter family protein
MWGLLGIISAVLLGIYDVLKKYSLNGNAVLPTLFVSVSAGALLFLPAIVGSAFVPDFFKSVHFYIKPISGYEHFLILIKSFIVVGSWILAFFAVKNLPITIVSPIRATGPIWTLLGALLIFSERLNPLQWLGLSVTLVFFFLFSTTGKLEGINFSKNKWIYFIVGATLLGSTSALYDKFIIRAIERVTVQAWFSVYQMAIMLPVTALLWYPKRKKHTPFQWRWTIPLIGITLVVTDYFYFYAISYPEALISVLSGIRRSGVVVAFVFGAWLFKDKNIGRKSIFLAGIIIGVMLMAFGSR